MSSLVTCQVVEQAEGLGGVVAKVEFNSPERLNALTVDLAAGTTRTYTHWHDFISFDIHVFRITGTLVSKTRAASV